MLPAMARSGKSIPGEKRGPGRQKVKTEPPLYPRQLVLKERRLEAGFGSQGKFARKIGLSTSYYSQIEGGESRLNADTAEKIGSLLPISDIFGVASPIMVPVKLTIGVALQQADPPLEYDLPEPWEMTTATNRKLKAIPDCFAAEIADDSADKDFARETVLYLRPINPAGEDLRLGTPVVVRFFDCSVGGTKVTSDMLYGLLDRTSAGDIVLITRSKTIPLPVSKMIRPGSARLREINEQTRGMIPWPATVTYAPDPEDVAIIVGTVVGFLGAL